MTWLSWRSADGRIEIIAVGRIDGRIFADVWADGRPVASHVEWGTAKATADWWRETTEVA